MATFECKVYELTIEEHPNADKIELARVGDYVSIVPKGTYQTGDLAVYIPEAALVPEWVLQRLGLWKNDKGMLAGKLGNRVKAIKLRGVVSQGLIFPVEFRPDCYCTGTDSPKEEIKDIYCVTREEGGAGYMVSEGADAMDFLDITKYEPPIPSSMSGEVFNTLGKTLHYDIENLKKHPDIIEEGEEVSITEKLHGTWCCMGYHPDAEETAGRIITSKGLSAKGLAFKLNEQNENNLYVQMYRKLTNGIGQDIMERFCRLELHHDKEPFYILGEVYGKGVQDLSYVDDNDKHFRVFDIYVGKPTGGHYLSPDEVGKICKELDIDTVPVLYSGTYSKELVHDLTNGSETVSGKELHMREGVVIRLANERRNDDIGRVILKSVSDTYLLRKGGTEHN